MITKMYFFPRRWRRSVPAAATAAVSIFAIGCKENPTIEATVHSSSPVSVESVDGEKKPGAQVSPPQVEGIPAGQVFALVCAACHGEKGEGKLELKAPAIAGLPSWYVLEQIGKFRNGFRGSNVGDIPGVQMKAIAVSLSPAQLKAASDHVETLSPKRTRIIAGGNIDRGRDIFAEVCMPCHRYNGQGEQAFHSAPLVTLNPEYLKRQLENYAKGWRGSAEYDFYGHKMVEVCSGLSDRDIMDLVRYIGELAHGDDPRKSDNW